MPDQPTRRQALKTAAVATALPAALVQAGAAPLVQVATPYEPRNLAPAEYRLLTALVDMIIPSSETPGAAAAGVDRYIDEKIFGDAGFRTPVHVFRKIISPHFPAPSSPPNPPAMELAQGSPFCTES